MLQSLQLSPESATLSGGNRGGRLRVGGGVVVHYLCKQMASASLLVLNFPGSSGIPSQNCDRCTNRFSRFRYGTAFVLRRNSKLQGPYLLDRHSSSVHTLSAGRDYQLNYNNNMYTEPFWLSPIRDVIWYTRSLLAFLAEQPSQLKYIEWPSFQSTLKTAILTLIIVALLIVALSSVDSALSYLLALFLRRKA